MTKFTDYPAFILYLNEQQKFVGKPCRDRKIQTDLIVNSVNEQTLIDGSKTIVFLLSDKRVVDEDYIEANIDF